MVDYAFLQGLSGRRDWDNIRAEKRQELQYQAAINSMRQKEVDRQAALKQQLDEYQNTVNELEVTPIGRERINERVNNPMKQAIAEKIKKYGGDLEAYMKVEGATDMNNYLQTLVNHPETQKELNNASDYSKWKADMEAGLEERKEIDPNTGDFAGGFLDQWQKYLNGETETVGYKGAFEPKKFDETFFSKIYGDTNRYKSVPVNAEDYAATAFRYLVEQGENEQDAAQQAFTLAKNYRSRVNQNGVPLRWKSDEWRPPTGWGDGETEKEAVKYIAERTGRLLKGDDSEVWDSIDVDMPNVSDMQLYDPNVGGWLTPKLGEKIVKTKRSSALNGLTLGDQTVRFVRKNPTTGLDEEYFSQIKDKVTDVIEQGGKVYIQTEKTKIDAANSGLPPEASYKEFNDNTIDELTLGAKDPRKASAALRRALTQMGVYSDGVVNFGGKKQARADIQMPKVETKKQTPQEEWNAKWAALPKGGSMLGLDGNTYTKK